MSVGLLFWIVSELSQLFRAHADEARDDRAKVAAMAVVDEITGPTVASPVPGLRPRPVLPDDRGHGDRRRAIYVMVGSIANYIRPEGYVRDIVWLLALALVDRVIGLVYGVASLTRLGPGRRRRNGRAA